MFFTGQRSLKQRSLSVAYIALHLAQQHRDRIDIDLAGQVEPVRSEAVLEHGMIGISILFGLFGSFRSSSLNWSGLFCFIT